MSYEWHFIQELHVCPWVFETFPLLFGLRRQWNYVSLPLVLFFTDPSGSLTSVCPPPPTTQAPPTPGPNTAVIVAGVIGGLVAALLLVLIVIFIIWYQVCRRDDPSEDTSRESAFDFSNKRTEASNPNALEEVKSDISAEKTSSPTTSSHAQLVDATKEDAPIHDTIL